MSPAEWVALLDLIARLRKARRHYNLSLCAEAADKLEALMRYASDLSKEVEYLHLYMDMAGENE